jgi:hypothetical protein
VLAWENGGHGVVYRKVRRYPPIPGMGFLILDLYEKLGGNAEFFYFTMKTSNHNDTPQCRAATWQQNR